MLLQDLLNKDHTFLFVFLYLVGFPANFCNRRASPRLYIYIRFFSLLLLSTSSYNVLYLVVFPANFTNRQARSCFRALPEIRTNSKTKTLKIINSQLSSKLEFCSHFMTACKKFEICVFTEQKCNISECVFFWSETRWNFSQKLLDEIVKTLDSIEDEANIVPNTVEMNWKCWGEST